MKTKINTIIFDLDGTLLNTLSDLADSLNHVMSQHDFPQYSADEVRQMIGNGVPVLIEQAIPRGRSNPLFDACLREFQDYYKKHMQIKTGPFDGIMQLLEALKKQGYRLAVVSNKFDAAVKELCHNYFGDLIQVAIGETAAIARKPAPDTVLEAMRQLHVSPQNCIYVGDSDVDIETARNSGIPCISVTWGFRGEEFLREHGASHIARDAKQLWEFIH